MAAYTNSYRNYGSAAAPTAGASIVSIANVPSGMYWCRIWILLSGTLAAGDQDNARVVIAGASGAQNDLQLLFPPTANTWGPRIDIPHLFQPANGTLTIAAIANATAGSVYRAVLVADPVGQVSG